MGLVDRIAADAGVSAQYLRHLVSTASHRYKTYQIPKRTGGFRIIHHPSQELKFLQRWVAERLFSCLPIHPAAMSYRRGRSVADNARIHADRNYLLRVDFENFFPSITAEDIQFLLERNAQRFPFPLEGADAQAIVKIVCRSGALTIGAPSSPVASNTVMYDFDRQWSDHCATKEVAFSRYADDVFFSTNLPNVLSAILKELRLDLGARLTPTLRINDSKTAFTSRKRRRLVTGLVLTSDRRVSLGRDRKRMLKGMLFRYAAGLLSGEQISYLGGFLAYARSVEPQFITALEGKYGEAVVRALIKQG